MNLILFLYIASFFSLTLGEFGQFPFASTGFSISITDILLSFNLTAILIWNIAIKKNLKLPNNFIFLIIFWAVGIFSLFLSLDLSGWFYLLRFVIYSSTFYLTYHLVKTKILGLDEFLALLKVTSITLAVLGFFQLIFFPDLEILSYLGYDPHKYRLFSTFLDPNFLGTFLSFSLACLIYDLTTKHFSNLSLYLKDNKWSLISVLILGLAILLTFSRSAYLISGIALLIILSVRSYKLLAGFLLLVVILYLVLPAFNNRIQGAINIDKSAGERFSSWEKGLIIFQENPALGVGFNNVRNYTQTSNLLKVFTPDGGNSGAGIDSGLIFVLATTGLVGFLSFITFLIRLISDQVSSFTTNIKAFYTIKLRPFKFMDQVTKLPGIGTWYRDSSSTKKLRYTNLSLPLLALSLGLLANSFFINSLFFPQIMFVFYSMQGVFYGLADGEGEES